MSVETKPRQVYGPWNEGYALHVHMLSSTFIGYDGYGHARFDSQRSPVGELLFQLKYRGNKEAVDQLAEAASEFLEQWDPPIQGIVPVPPSVTRQSQPVIEVANALATRIDIPLLGTALTKVKQTPQLKDIIEYDKRTEALKDAFAVASNEVMGKKLLLFDDLIGSGATVGHITEALKTGGAEAVYLLTLTTK